MCPTAGVGSTYGGTCANPSHGPGLRTLDRWHDDLSPGVGPVETSGRIQAEPGLRADAERVCHAILIYDWLIREVRREQVGPTELGQGSGPPRGHGPGTIVGCRVVTYPAHPAHTR